MDLSLYKIADVNRMDPFLITITSGEDHWMYLSSTGCMTAGRKKAKHTLFPYITDDLLHRNAHFTGPVTIIRIKGENNHQVWHPFKDNDKSFKSTKNLYKNSLGNIVIFEEINHTLGLIFSYKWQSSAEYGFIRKSRLKNLNSNELQIELMDGLRNIMPAGIELHTQQEMSNLANAYRISEYQKDADCALFFMNALLMDSPEPGESLYSNIVWSHYKGEKEISLCEKDINLFSEQGEISGDNIVKGKPGCFLTKFEKPLNPNDEIYWYTVADVYKSQSEITHIITDILDTEKIEKKLEDSIKKNYFLLDSAVGSADGFQCTNKVINDLHHTANSMFNLLRGGVFFFNYDLKKEDFLKFLRIRNKQIFEQYSKEITELPSVINLKILINFADQTEDSSLKRLCREYLPLKLGRRHGDPSRPWNHFEIRTRDEKGNQLFYYEGNWRDIFQNWEALGYSYPAALESMVTIFLDAITMDGFNPYRITSEGIDWEIIEPDDTWSYIGYWNDHQIIYLLKLLEHMHNYDSSKIEHLFVKSIFSYANIPYKIRDFIAITRNPKNTIKFDFEQEKIIKELTKKIGSDGKLVLNHDETVYHVNLCEKILVLTLAKICNLIPGAGIWLNTQRPEWNDANNALVGYGTSMVTVYYLKRFLSFFIPILKDMNHTKINVSTEVTIWFNTIKNLLSKWQENNSAHNISNKYRMKYISMLGASFSEYRMKIYEKGYSGKNSLGLDSIIEFFYIARNELNNTILLNKNDSGFYNAYNTINLDHKSKSLDIQCLPIMLEGQVASLSSEQNDIDQVIKILEKLFESNLYRKDQNSFILYPEKDTMPFLERNIISEKDISKSKLLETMLKENNINIIEQDADGLIRFRPYLRNTFDVQNKLEQLINNENYRNLVKQDYHLILEIFEKVFNHRNFTGRSGTMFSYEGMGSIYWHMVSKLLLAVQENYFIAVDNNAPIEKVKKIARLYYDIRGGLSAEKTPIEYGAFPYDPYSHTPFHSGAQQPGMTGQVKEEIITRFGELGCRIFKGCIKFDPSLLKKNEFVELERIFEYYNVLQEKKYLIIKNCQLAYTFCQVPIVYKLSKSKSKIILYLKDGLKTTIDSNTLTKKQSRYIFNRENKIIQIDVFINHIILMDYNRIGEN